MNPLTFNDGLPVPDGIPYSEISKSIYPSNISVITADNLKGALLQTFHSIRHGKQGVVWLANHHFPKPVTLEERMAHSDKVDDFKAKIVEQISSSGDITPIKSFNLDDREERVSRFHAHIDNLQGFYHENLRTPKLNSLRIVFNVFGLGSVVFPKNTALAHKLANPYYREMGIDPVSGDDFDVAYICPRGSVLFVVGGDAGYNNALIHSPPNLLALDNHDFQRELIVADCFMSP
jgi:hypothetical protein